MISLHPEDVHRVLSRLPKDVRDLMKEHPIIVAGGFIRAVIAREEAKDIDLFGPSDSVLEAGAEQIIQNRIGCHVVRTDNATTVARFPQLPVQFIKRWKFDDAWTVIQSLDFTVCQAAIWFQPDSPPSWRSVAADTFYVDLASKRLRYTLPVREEASGGSMLRVLKYLGRGYTISPESLAQVMARCTAGIDLETGVEPWTVIAARLREVDPLKIVDGLPVEEEQP